MFLPVQVLLARRDSDATKNNLMESDKRAADLSRSSMYLERFGILHFQGTKTKELCCISQAKLQNVALSCGFLSSANRDMVFLSLVRLFSGENSKT